MDDYEKIKLFNIKLIYVNSLFKIRDFNNEEKKLIIDKINRAETRNRVEWFYHCLLRDGDRFLKEVQYISPIKGIKIRRWILRYRDYEERMTDDIGNKFIVIKHKM
jgi:hypothetical protein